MARPPCSIDGCESESKGRGWCGKHYQRWKKHGSPTPEGVEERDMSHGPCAVKGCPRDRAKKGLCGLHYQRYRIHGDTSSTAFEDVSLAAERTCRRCGVDISHKRSNAVYCGRVCKTGGARLSAKNGQLLTVEGKSLPANPRTRESERERNRARYQKERERRIEYARSQYWSDPERSREYSRRYRSENPEIRLAQHMVRRARKSGAESRTVSAAELDAIKNRQRGECYYCGERKPLVVDHVIPLAKGGRHAIGNLTGSCQTCNSSKGAMLLIEWRVYMKRKGVSLTL